jgi:restriction system protein
MPGFFPGFLIVGGIVRGVRESRRKRHPSPNLLAFLHALREHKAYVARTRAEADKAAIVEQELLRRKRSYWERLNGYQFEMEAAEILKRHQFDARVTRGSADGGVDIEVTRNGLKGVVQCKAHVACVGPHVVRDLYGVIHHSGADFGIIVSLGGFTQAAIDFARSKPILFVDVSDLIAMQEGQDILGGSFTRKEK